MKQKFLFLGMLLLLISAVFAFTYKPSSPVNTAGELWFEYDGTGDVSQPGNYVLFEDGSESPNCLGGSKRCAIKAQPQSANPSLPNMNTIVQTATKP